MLRLLPLKQSLFQRVIGVEECDFCVLCVCMPDSLNKHSSVCVCVCAIRVKTVCVCTVCVRVVVWRW